ncbi:guanitoxin biosynthesis heme-dependent pre-guanitoxin N-hydroxylase GntA [Micromonospora haikouensis]|uniref:guanitoxin biosynthesis heme-dependent pre-guanitoxin N-hydroxylase GntA n=1 Tax=Micromonospora haikouensis TaxID=686309 RepID=UPI003D757ACA
MERAARGVPRERPRRDTGPVPGALKELVRGQLHALVSAQPFPCLGARSALANGSYLFNLHEDMGSSESLRDLAADLRHFAQVRLELGDLYSYVASFVEPRVPGDEAAWASCFWALMQRLHEIDEDAWDHRFSRDPESPDFAFSFAGLGHLVVTLYPGASRFSRRFAWPTLVFNPLEQDRAQFPEDEAFLRFRDQIRLRDARLQGQVNPSLPKTLDDSQVPGFAGAPVPSDWRCPLRLRPPPEAGKPTSQ